MKSLDLGRYVISTCVACVMFSGCGGSQPPIGAPGAMPQSSAIAAHANRGGAWMLPEAKSEDLLYVSNLHNVKVYSYPKGKHVGTLSGFYLPFAECADKAGDVFITDGPNVTEYAHAAKKPSHILTFAGYEAIDCASDPTTGDLAVTYNQISKGYYLAVYQNATGTPTLYQLGDMGFLYCGYDDFGNLYVDGEPNDYSGFLFAELPSGGSKLMNITLNQTFGYPGPVQWDGKYITVEDLNAYNIYRFTISGSTGTLHGTTSLEGLSISYQGWIIGHRVLEPNVDFVSDQPLGQVVYYDYPKGGSAIKIIQDGDDTAPKGVTVSVAPH